MENLNADDFKKFKWFLPQGLDGFPAIPECRLENADRMDTVDQMMKIYHVNTVKMAMMVLGRMGNNDLVEKLSNAKDLVENLSNTTSGPTRK